MKTLPLQSEAYQQLETDFKEWLNLLGYSDRTVYALPNYLREFLQWLETQKIADIKAVNGDDAKTFIHRVSERANKRRAGGLSNNHLNKYIQALKLFSKYIRSTDQGHYTLDMAMTKGERPYLDGNKNILTTEEIKALYKACDYTPFTPLALRDKAMLSIFYGCGLRRNEGVMLDVDDLLFDKQLLYVRKGKHYKERYVPMNAKVIEDLNNYLYDGRPYIVRGRNNKSFFVSDRIGSRMQGQSLMVRLKRLQQIQMHAYGKSEIHLLKEKDIGLHTLRHSIATHLLQSGMRLQDIATFLGHKTLDSTQIYTHIKYENL